MTAPPTRTPASAPAPALRSKTPEFLSGPGASANRHPEGNHQGLLPVWFGPFPGRTQPAASGHQLLGQRCHEPGRPSGRYHRGRPRRGEVRFPRRAEVLPGLRRPNGRSAGDTGLGVGLLRSERRQSFLGQGPKRRRGPGDQRALTRSGVIQTSRSAARSENSFSASKSASRLANSKGWVWAAVCSRIQAANRCVCPAKSACNCAANSSKCHSSAPFLGTVATLPSRPANHPSGIPAKPQLGWIAHQQSRVRRARKGIAAAPMGP